MSVGVRASLQSQIGLKLVEIELFSIGVDFNWRSVTLALSSESNRSAIEVQLSSNLCPRVRSVAKRVSHRS